MNTNIYSYCPSSNDDEIGNGPLSGMSVIIQPDLNVCNWPADAGSKALFGFHSIFDATLISRLKAAGAAIAGSARMAELGFGISGSTIAQALAADDELKTGLMTDTLGEARMAASLEGLWGFKPSWGILSRYGVTGYAPSFECTGILAKKPADIIEMLLAMIGPDDKDFSMCADQPPDMASSLQSAKNSSQLLNIGVPKEIENLIGTSASAAFSEGLDIMARAGFTIKEVSIPDFGLFASSHQVIAAAEASSAAGKYDGVRYGFRSETNGNWNDMYLTSRGEAFGPLIKALLMQGAYFQFQDYSAFEAACTLRRELIKQTEALFSDVDFLAMPTRPGSNDPMIADTVPEVYAAFGLTIAANLTGLPALQVPGLARSAGNKPCDYGIQIIAPRMGDADVLAAGLALFSHIQ